VHGAVGSSSHRWRCVQADLKQKEAQANLVYPYSASYNKTRISDILQAADGGRSLVSSSATVTCSWHGQQQRGMLFQLMATAYGLHIALHCIQQQLLCVPASMCTTRAYLSHASTHASSLPHIAETCCRHCEAFRWPEHSTHPQQDPSSWLHAWQLTHHSFPPAATTHLGASS
jgi:hypothetical protein